MKGLKFILCPLILGLFAASLTLSAQSVSAEITNLDILHDQDLNGRKGIKVISRIVVNGLKDKQFTYNIWIESPQGTEHIVSDTDKNRYNVKYFTTTLTATYESTLWESYTYPIYHSELQLKPGQHTYHLFATVNTLDGNCIARSEYVSFNGTGSSGNSGNQNYHNHSHNSGEITCPNCNGSGSAACVMCGGGGKQFGGLSQWACNVCNGAGMLKCHICSGRGRGEKSEIDAWYVHCMTCNGTGVAGCLVCRGNGYTSSGWCSNCNGNGRKSCYSCHGYGKVKKSWGSGSYSGGDSGSGSHGSGSSSSGCSFCGGSGVCSSCSGKGGSWKDTGYYVGDHTQSWINCPSCNGSSKCFNCHGTGRQ